MNTGEKRNEMLGALPLKKCRVCGNSVEIVASRVRQGQHICRACKAIYDRQWRKANPAAIKAKHLARRQSAAHHTPEMRQKRQARKAVEAAILGGKLFRQPCEVCQAIPAEAHHEDYSKPLEVRWLCPHHHRQHHLALDRKEAA